MATRASRSSARVAWTLGWLAFVIHVIAAFHYVHAWSHAEAFRHVEEVGGFGEGIFVSYAFLLFWTADVVWWWASPGSHRTRPGWLTRAWLGVMVFVTFNAGVVFEEGLVRWAVAGGLLLLVGVMLVPSRRSRASAGPL